jgi:hypothetical protein
MSGCAILAAPSPWPVLLQTTPSAIGSTSPAASTRTFLRFGHRRARRNRHRFHIHHQHPECLREASSRSMRCRRGLDPLGVRPAGHPRSYRPGGRGNRRRLETQEVHVFAGPANRAQGRVGARYGGTGERKQCLQPAVCRKGTSRDVRAPSTGFSENRELCSCGRTVFSLK